MTLWTLLLRWYDRHGRDLPWRHTRDPYQILVSEIMLQQTQVSRGLVFYDRWLAKFPDWQSLARASNADVIRAWAGLGYNRRALILRDIARQMVENSKKQETKTIDTEDEWLGFKGIGPYTAAAIAAFAFHRRTLPIDTNIRRALGRLLFGTPYPQPAIDERIRASIDLVLPRRGRFYDVPQALFDLATIHCTKLPDCAACPMRRACLASEKFLSGRVRVPKQMVRQSPESRHSGKPFPDRIYRGRILKLVREKERVPIDAVGPLVDPGYDKANDHDWMIAMIERLKRDNLIASNRSSIRLA